MIDGIAFIQLATEVIAIIVFVGGAAMVVGRGRNKLAALQNAIEKFFKRKY